VSRWERGEVTCTEEEAEGDDHGDEMAGTTGEGSGSGTGTCVGTGRDAGGTGAALLGVGGIAVVVEPERDLDLVRGAAGEATAGGATGTGGRALLGLLWGESFLGCSSTAVLKDLRTLASADTLNLLFCWRSGVVSTKSRFLALLKAAIHLVRIS